MLNKIFVALLLASAPLCAAAWTPPVHRDTMIVLGEVKADRSQGRYADALEKLEWFYANANDAARPIRRTTQLPFAAAEWGKLAKLHPPAHVSLLDKRDRAEKRVREGGDPAIWFREVTMFNKELDDPARNVVLFKWLHENKPENAKQAFRYIDEQLFEAREYKLCGQYIDADASMNGLIEIRRKFKNFDAPNEKESTAITPISQSYFERRSAMLVALLVINGKPKDAERIAKRARAEVSGKAFAATLDAALKGTMPMKDPNCDSKRHRC